MGKTSRVVAVSVCSALAASLLILDSAGIMPLAKSRLGESPAGEELTLRGGRRLQEFRQAALLGPDGGVAGHLHQAAGHLHQGAQYGHQFAANGMSNAYESMSMGFSNLRHILNSFLLSHYHFILIFLQAIFAVLYYSMVVSQYPYWNSSNPMSCELQAEPAPYATTQTSGKNCFLSFCCPQARAAHTFDKTYVLNYWLGIVAMLFCPFCTLCWANACTDLNLKLGGEPASVFASAVDTWCCPCCVISQDAESLDAATGVRTGLCGVSQDMPMYGYNGNMMPGYGGDVMPRQLMIQPGMYAGRG